MKQRPLINPEVLKDWTNDDFLEGYFIVNGTLKLPDWVKYPSIPCYIDETDTIYP